MTHKCTYLRSLLALALCALALLIPGGVRADGGGGGDNAAVAINTKDTQSVFRFAFKIRRVAGDVVDNRNTAFAYASCTDCRTTAIAVQIVLATNHPTTVTPFNNASAINDNCTRCSTFASAHQIVRTTDGPVRFTAAGNDAIAKIRHEIRSLEDTELAPEEVKARMSAFHRRLVTIVNTELVQAGSGDAQADADEDASADGHARSGEEGNALSSKFDSDTGGP